MILSHAHRFIFIKTAKTAGTSIEIALSKFLGPEDVLTPTSSRDDADRRISGGRLPQNYRRTRAQYTPLDLPRLVLQGVPKARFHKHMGASEIRSLISKQTWNSYFKFCVERNPWERAISLYYWRKKAGLEGSLAEFVASGALKDLRNKGWNLYTIDGKTAVDHILRFEDLERELEQVRQRLGLSGPLELPRAKGNARTDRRHYTEVLTAEDRQRIAEMFREEIELMGYVPDARLV